MSIAKSIAALLALAALAAAQTADWQSPDKAVAIVLEGAPVELVAKDLSQTAIRARGGAAVIDLKGEITLRNGGQKSVRAVTLLVEAQEFAAGGKASVAVPSLRVAGGETFAAQLRLRLVRPLPAPTPAVRISIDGVLYDDYTFAGPNALASRQRMTAWEREADRDRAYFRGMLQDGGDDLLRETVLTSLSRQRQRPQLRATPVSDAVANAASERVAVAALNFSTAPLEITSGEAATALSTVQAPQFSVLNRERRAIRSYEIGWLVEDRTGQRYSTGFVAATSAVGPGAAGRTADAKTFRLSPAAGPGAVEIKGLSAYVRRVYFDDGAVWIPTRGDLESSFLAATVPVSAEEQRLTKLYTEEGLQALIQELSRFE